jgi:hypothetical protein
MPVVASSYPAVAPDGGRGGEEIFLSAFCLRVKNPESEMLKSSLKTPYVSLDNHNSNNNPAPQVSD